MATKPNEHEEAEASEPPHPNSGSESTGTSAPPQNHLPDDPAELIEVLKGELRRLVEDSGSDDGTEDSIGYTLSLLKHAHTLAWQGVAQGDLDIPGRILGLLQHLQRFVDRHTPALPPKGRAAVEIRSAVTAFFIAHESLAEVRTKVRLADRERSAIERNILRILAESSESYLRRGQVYDRLRLVSKPSLARIGQVLVQLSSEGLLKRIQASAQGNPETAYYGLSPLGHEICEKLRLLGTSDILAVNASFEEVLRNVFAPLTRPDAQVRHRISMGLVSQVAFSSNMQRFVNVAYYGYKLAEKSAEPERAEQAFLVLNCVGANLAAAAVLQPDERGTLALTQDPKRWNLVPEELRQQPTPPERRGDYRAEALEPPTTTAPRLTDRALKRLYADVPQEHSELALLKPYEEALQPR